LSAYIYTDTHTGYIHFFFFCRYNYSRDDEEIYKEFLEIANELIPHAMKVVSSGHSARSILKNASCFASLLRFYDGICRWEEGSATPVLHIGWAKPLVNTISKFDAAVRARVDITLATEPEPGNPNHSQPRRRASSDTKYMAAENNNNYELIRSLESQVGPTPASPHPSIAALTEACGETLLNPGYLLRGIGSPFTNNRLLLAPAAGSGTAEDAEEALLTTVEQPIHEDAESEEEEDEEEERPSLELHSRKMAGLKELLLAEKLNTSAISLQLTAQSQVQVGGRKTRADPVADVVPNFPAAAAAAATVPATATANSATAVPGVRAKRARTRD
jgi:menin